MRPVKRICVFEHSVMTSFNCACPAIWSVRVAEQLALPTSDHGVAGSNPAGGEILPEPKWRFTAQRLSCSPFNRFEMTEILLKGCKTLTHPFIHAQPFRGARDPAFCLKVPLDSLLVSASSGCSGETARMRWGDSNEYPPRMFYKES